MANCHICDLQARHSAEATVHMFFVQRKISKGFSIVLWVERSIAKVDQTSRNFNDIPSKSSKYSFVGIFRHWIFLQKKVGCLAKSRQSPRAPHKRVAQNLWQNDTPVYWLHKHKIFTWTPLTQFLSSFRSIFKSSLTSLIVWDVIGSPWIASDSGLQFGSKLSSQDISLI